MQKGARWIVFIMLAATFLLAPYVEAQKCLEGDCHDGFGEMDAGDSFYVGSFVKGKWEGPGIRYNKATGAITMAFYQDGHPTISIVEFYSGALEFGYRKKNDSDGNLYLYNGFNFREEGLFKFIDGSKSNLNFGFEGAKCLLGDCENGFGAEYLIEVDIKLDTAAFLYVGYYKEGNWEGDGAYFEFGTGDFFVGKFQDNAEWNGALINNEVGIASFMVEGKEVKLLSYTIPEAPPWRPDQVTAQPTDGKQKGFFWKGLGEYAAEATDGEVRRTGTRQEIAIINKTLNKIDRVSISTKENPNWSGDLLGQDLLFHGQKFTLKIPSGYRRSCTVDLQAISTDGVTTTWHNLDLCKHYTFELTQKGKFLPLVD